MPPAHSTTKGMGRPPKPRLQPDPWTHPYPPPHVRNQPAPASGSEQGNLFLVFAPSCGRWSPAKDLPEFFDWPLINFY